MKAVYFLFCVVGTLLPLSQFAGWLVAHGLDIPLLLRHAVETPISAFAWADVLVTGLTVAVFVMVEGQRLGMRRPWLALLGLSVGPSLALPLFLLLREQHKSQHA